MSKKVPKRNCLSCSKALKRADAFYCTNECQQRYQYTTFIKKWLSGQISGYGVHDVISKHIKKYLILTYGEYCCICGWCKVNRVTGNIPIELDHIDGNHRNCRPENLRLLCPNCHSLTSTFRNLNAGKGRASRRKIAGVASIGRGPVL